MFFLPEVLEKRLKKEYKKFLKDNSFTENDCSFERFVEAFISVLFSKSGEDLEK